MNKSQDKTSEKNKRESNGESGERMAEPGKGLSYTVEPPLMDIFYSGHLIIQDKMLHPD